MLAFRATCLFGCNCLWDISLWCWCAWYTPFSTPCDDVMLILLGLCLPFGFLCFFAFLHVCLHVHARVLACLCYEASFLLSRTSSHPSLIHKTSSPFWEFCLMACVSSILQSNGTMGIRSKPTFVLLGQPLLFDNMFVCPHLALFVSVSLCMLSLSLCYLFACSLCLLHVHLWSKDAWSDGTTS